MENKLSSTYSILSYPAKDLPPQYLNMILSKWLRSLKYGNDYYRLIDSAAYFAHYNNFILHLLKKPDTIVRLAVLTDDHDVVLGWSVHRGDVLDFIHVHKDMRKQGIGSSLLPKDIKTITHITTPAMFIWSSKYPHFIFNPFA